MQWGSTYCLQICLVVREYETKAGRQPDLSLLSLYRVCAVFLPPLQPLALSSCFSVQGEHWLLLWEHSGDPCRVTPQWQLQSFWAKQLASSLACEQALGLVLGISGHKYNGEQPSSFIPRQSACCVLPCLVLKVWLMESIHISITAVKMISATDIFPAQGDQIGLCFLLSPAKPDLCLCEISLTTPHLSPTAALCTASPSPHRPQQIFCFHRGTATVPIKPTSSAAVELVLFTTHLYGHSHTELLTLAWDSAVSLRTRRFSFRRLEAARKPSITVLITLTREKNTLKAASDIFFLFTFVV